MEIKCKCNCKKEWETKCKYRSSWLEKINNGMIFDYNGNLVKGTCLKVYNDWFQYAEKFKNYCGAKKNNEILLNFLENNYEGNCCYYDISSALIEIIEISYKVEDKEDLRDFIMSYLYWSYGTPFDENNLIRKYFVKKAMEKYKCNCKEEWGKKCSYRSNSFLLNDILLYSDKEFGVKPEWVKYTYMYSPYVKLKKKMKF